VRRLGQRSSRSILFITIHLRKRGWWCRLCINGNLRLFEVTKTVILLLFFRWFLEASKVIVTLTFGTWFLLLWRRWIWHSFKTAPFVITCFLRLDFFLCFWFTWNCFEASPIVVTFFLRLISFFCRLIWLCFLKVPKIIIITFLFVLFYFNLFEITKFIITNFFCNNFLLRRLTGLRFCVFKVSKRII